jgi:hypothetical protein
MRPGRTGCGNPAFVITALQVEGRTLVVDFNGAPPGNTFILEGAPSPVGRWLPVPDTTLQGDGSVFQFRTPLVPSLQRLFLRISSPR